MATPTPGTRTRKAVSTAIAKQDSEQKKASKKKAKPVVDIQEAIRMKAYELYVARGYVHGNDAEDWLIAERIVLGNNPS